MRKISKLLMLVKNNPWLIKGALILIALWVVLNLICLILGAVGLYTLGKKKGCKPYIAAFLPGGQICYTLRLAGKERLARRAEVLVWWLLTLIVCAGVALIWAVTQYLCVAGGVKLLLAAFAALMLGALVLYVWLRRLELRGLSRVFKDKAAWILSLVGCVIGIPIQRVLLFIGRHAYMK